MSQIHLIVYRDEADGKWAVDDEGYLFEAQGGNCWDPDTETWSWGDDTQARGELDAALGIGVSQ